MADTGIMLAGELGKQTIYIPTASTGFMWAALGLLAGAVLSAAFRLYRHEWTGELMEKGAHGRLNLQLGSLIHIALLLTAAFSWFYYSAFVFYGLDTTTIDTGYGFWITAAVANFCLFLIYHLRPLSNHYVRYPQIADKRVDQTWFYLGTNVAIQGVFFLAWNVGLAVLFYLEAVSNVLMGVTLIAVTAVYLACVIWFIYHAFNDRILASERYWVVSMGVFWIVILLVYSLMVILSPVIGNVITYNQLGTAYLFIALGSLLIFGLADLIWEIVRFRSNTQYKTGKRM